MWVRLMPPFGDGNTWHEIHLPAKSGVKELIDKLVVLNPHLSKHVRQTVEESLHQFILLRNDHVLKPGDAIKCLDRIVVVMPLTGG